MKGSKAALLSVVLTTGWPGLAMAFGPADDADATSADAEPADDVPTDADPAAPADTTIDEPAGDVDADPPSDDLIEEPDSPPDEPTDDTAPDPAPKPETGDPPSVNPDDPDRDAAKDAEQDDTPRVLQPLVLGKDALILGGYIQPGFIHVSDTDFNQNDQNGFDFGNARITGKGDRLVYKKLYIGFRFNFDVNRGNFGVRDVYGTVGWRDGLIALDVGQLKQPHGLALLQSESKLQFSFSPQIRRFAFGRDQGAKLSSQGTIGKRFWMKGAVMVSNGEGGFRQRRNLDNEFQYTGRLEVGPLGKLELSEPELNGSKAKFVLGFSAGHTPSLGKGLGLDDVGASETRLGGDARVAWKGLSVRGEYMHGFRGDNGMASPKIERRGTYAQAGYLLPIPEKWVPLPKFEIVFRFQQVDLDTTSNGFEDPANPIIDNTEFRIYEPGLNIYLFKHSAKLLVSYQLTDLLEGPRTDSNGAPLLGDAVFAFFQFAWL